MASSITISRYSLAATSLLPPCLPRIVHGSRACNGIARYMMRPFVAACILKRTSYLLSPTPAGPHAHSSVLPTNCYSLLLGHGTVVYPSHCPKASGWSSSRWSAMKRWRSGTLELERNRCDATAINTNSNLLILMAKPSERTPVDLDAFITGLPWSDESCHCKNDPANHVGISRAPPAERTSAAEEASQDSVQSLSPECDTVAVPSHHHVVSDLPCPALDLFRRRAAQPSRAVIRQQPTPSTYLDAGLDCRLITPSIGAAQTA